MAKSYRNLLLHCFLPLLISLAVYVLFRTGQTVVNRLLLSPLNHPLAVKSWPGEIMVYNLPGALWLYAFVYFNSVFDNRRVMRFIPLLTALAIELVQLLGITNGTFDGLDVLFYILSWLLCCRNISIRDNSMPVIPEIRFLQKRRLLACFFFMAIVFLSDV